MPINHGLWALTLTLAAAYLAPHAAWAQNSNWVEPAPWQEAETPLPRILRTDNLLKIEFPGSSLKLGIDPESVTVGTDGAIRYVVVATGVGGAVNAMQEGVRCPTFEVKTFARYYPDKGWTPVKDAAWQSLTKNSAYRHSLVIARNGLCTPDQARRTASQIVRDLR